MALELTPEQRADLDDAATNAFLRSLRTWGARIYRVSMGFPHSIQDTRGA